MSHEKPDLAGIKEELATISVALSVIAINEVDAGNAIERKRHEEASVKALDFLLARIEGR